MVNTATPLSQLTEECNAWRTQMRRYRDEFTHFKDQLKNIAARITQREYLRDVEHYENQFYIQLINIHDLKHSIKVHDFKTATARLDHNGRVNHTTLAEHQHLYAEFQRLQRMLEELKGRFMRFAGKLN